MTSLPDAATAVALEPLCRMAVGFGELVDPGPRPRYRWLNGVLGVGRGHVRADLSGLDYDIYVARDAAGS